MKIFTSIFIFCLFSHLLSAQPWTKNLPAYKSKSEITLFDYQKAFEEYWAPFNLDHGYYIENGIKKKAVGWKQFKRWEYDMKRRVNPITGEFPRKTTEQVYEDFISSHAQPRTSVQAEWKSLGPDYSYGGYSGIGRIASIAFHPTNNNIYWIGSAAGGLWVTYDNGSSWTCLTNNNAVLAVSSIAIPTDYETSHTIYIATGDRDSWDNRSIGVLKSTDGGSTWNPTGLSFTIFENKMVNKLLMDPNNNKTLIAATNRGVFKTTDGGNTWDQQLTTTEFIDMEYQPGNFNTLYGATKNGKIFVKRSGSPWWLLTFNDFSASRMELAVSPAQPEWVYAVGADGGGGLRGIYKSENAGYSFRQVFDGNTTNLLTWAADGSGGGGQGSYDLCLAVSPTDARTLLVGGINTWRSEFEGYGWSIVSHWIGDQAPAVHADKHYLAYRANGDVFECNDGGVYISSDNGSTWQDKTNGIAISQMYKLGVSQTDPNVTITGLQDNGTKIRLENYWIDKIGGDGMECLVDYTNADIQYGTLYYGRMTKTVDRWNSSWDVTPSGADDGGWITPYIIDPVDPATLYAGYTEIWKTTDRGENWIQISDFKTAITFGSMAIAPSDNKVLYVANSNQIWKTTNGGGNWVKVTNNLPSFTANIEYITVKNDDPNWVWVALSGYTNPGIYQTTDGGLTWTDISSGLPPIPTMTVVENKLMFEEINLYAGTDNGVYYKKGNDDWVRFNDGLPNVIVNELEIYYAPNVIDSKLRAATYGRGLWETSIPYSSIPLSTPKNSLVCSGSIVSLNLMLYDGDIQWQYSLDGESEWVNVVSGSGANTDNYVTDELTSTIHYRAFVSNPDSDTLYSTISKITVFAIPADAGPITGDQTICQRDEDVTYTVDPIQNATSYVWTFPDHVTGTSTTNSITVDFGITPSGIIKVFGRNYTCDGGSSELAIEVTPRPARPSIGTKVEPTCEDSTGTVTLNSLPEVGEWTITRSPDGAQWTGTGTSYTVNDIMPGTYTFTATNELGCTSTKTISVIIHAHGTTPETPVITEIGNVLNSNAPTGNQWYDDNGIILGATDQDIIPGVDGNYYVIVTIDGCPSAPSNSINLVGTSISSDPYLSFVHIYPNPVTDELKIEIPGNSKNVQYEILNSLGQVVHKGEMEEKTTVATGSFSSGVYFVKIEVDGKMEFRKLVKE